LIEALGELPNHPPVRRMAALAEIDPKTSRRRWLSEGLLPARVALWLGWVALVLLLLLALPFYLCMAPWVDCTFFDICARTLLNGGTLYREVFLHGPPGMVLVQAGIRQLIGWRHEALKAVDFTIAMIIVWALVTCVQPRPLSTTARLWSAVAISLFYLGNSEWCHCQPDMWMLIPSLLAVCLRQHQVAELIEGNGGWSIWLRSFAEGACWGAAMTIKPFVAVPAVLCWLVGAAWVVRCHRPRFLKLLLADGLATAAGAASILSLTAGWMSSSGNWPYFLEAMRWNSEYLEHSPQLSTRTHRMLGFALTGSPIRMGAIHLVAVPVALATMGWAWIGGRRWAAILGEPASSRALVLASFYLGWLIQANYIQRQFDYHMMPAILLAMAWLAAQTWFWRNLVVQFVVVPACLIAPAVENPLFWPSRLALWGRCWHEGSSPALRDGLGLERFQYVNPSWQELERIENYLRERRPADRQVTSYALSAAPIYLALDSRPSTRFIFLWTALSFFPNHAKEIRAELFDSGQLYGVCDERDLPHPSVSHKPDPWSGPIMFRCGRYQVRWLGGGPERSFWGWPG
jgi:hypothetical protein